MGNKKISELPAAESQDLTGSNSLLHVVNPDRVNAATRNRKATWAQVKDALVNQGAVMGPASTPVVAGRVVSFDGTGGRLVQEGVGDGAVGTPSVTFASDLDTGMWRPAADTLAFSTNGAERLRVLATGNVGIGTATPARLLDVGADAAIHSVRVGRGAGDIITNTAVGSRALNSNTTGADNTAAGRDALTANTTGTRNVAVGRDALFSNTTGNDNNAIGANSLRLNTTGSRNHTLGRSALGSNTSGADNISLGVNSLTSNTTGNNNVAAGSDALRENTTSANSVAYGFEAVRRFVSATGEQTGVGYRALYGGDATPANNTGGQNTAVGHQAGDGITTGATNTIVGHNAGRSITTGSGNTVLGAGLAGSAALANTVLIGSSGAERMRIDSSGNVGIGTTSPAAALDVAGTGALKTPVGTDAQRPTPATGMLRFNSDAGSFEGYDAAAWRGIVAGPGSATDGAVALYDGTTGKLLKDGPVPGAASGLATLDTNTRVPLSQMNANIGTGYTYPFSTFMYYSNQGNGTITNGSTGGEDRVYGVPIWLPTGTAVRISMEVTTAATVTGVYRLGLYNPDLSLLVDAGTVDVTTTGIKDLTINVPIRAGVYIVVNCLQNLGGGSGPQVKRVTGTNTNPFYPMLDSGGNLSVTFGTAPIFSGNLPDPITFSNETTLATLVYVGVE